MDGLTRDGLRIWQAGVDAVRADRVLRDRVHWDGRFLAVRGETMDLQDAQRFIVIGAGKAGGGMLAGLADVLGAHSTESGLRTTGGKELIGWVNIPEGSIPSSLAHATGFRFLAARDDSAELDQTIGRDCGVTLCEARPRGVNEPTALAVRGTAEILRMVEQATPRDVVLCLLSGGSSALLCAPVSWLSLETKVAITRALSSRGAGINELNAVRRCLSNVKGGGLARRCRAGRLITLVISDVMGDPLEIIGSGPTVIEPKPDRTLAADILERFVPGEFNTVVSRLREASSPGNSSSGNLVQNFVLANNLSAVEGAKREAERLGYRVRVESCIEGEGSTDGVAERLVSNLVADLISKDANTDGLVSGGEPTVVLPDSAVRGRGGRNQHLVLSVAKSLASEPDCRALLQSLIEERASMVFVSGGTDGEDGASDAAGAWIDGEWIRANANRLDWMKDGLRRCDSNTLFRETGHTIETGATHTNVCDLRVLLYKLHG